MSSNQDQNPILEAMFQTGGAKAQGARQIDSPPQGNALVVKDLKELQQDWVGRHSELWSGMLDPSADPHGPQVTKPETRDKRRDRPAGADNPLFDYLHQAYRINSEFIKGLTEVAPLAEGTAKDNMLALTRQVVKVMAPANLLAAGPSLNESEYLDIRDELTSGDIVVTCKGDMKSFNNFLSLLIRVFTASSYSHVGVVVKLGNRCFIVEATPPVVRLFPVSKLKNFYVLKMEESLTREDENRLFDYLGMPYSDWNSIASYFTGRPLDNGKLQCAQLVSSFYNWPNLLRPEQIVKYVQEQLGKQMIFVR